MEETIDSGYQDFVAAFDGDGNQTVTDQETGAQTEEQADTEQETTVTDEGAEKSDEGTGEDTGGEVDAPEESDKPDAEQTFTIKVNKEERTVGLAEMTALAQKGADYDRVKERAQQTIQELRTQLDGQKDVMEIMTTLAEKTGTPLNELAEMLYVSYRKGEGRTETEAKLELQNARLQKGLDAVNAEKDRQKEAEESSQSRAQREVDEFRRSYPDVEFTDELVSKLTPDVQAGMTLLNAYQKYEAAQKEARIAELERQLAAEKKNWENRSSSPGSQKDSGGQRGKSDFDDFLSAFA
nr:MAG TPA: hypothetical protein [Caudoviricetes sp.]